MKRDGSGKIKRVTKKKHVNTWDHRFWTEKARVQILFYLKLFYGTFMFEILFDIHKTSVKSGLWCCDLFSFLAFTLRNRSYSVFSLPN